MAWVVSAIVPFLSLIFVMTYVHYTDRTSIISLRRTLALFLISTIIWLLVFGMGVISSAVMASPLPFHSSFLLGGFLALGFEIVVIHSVFVKNMFLSFVLAALHPISLFAVVLPKLQPSIISYSIASSGGILVLGSILFFLHRINSYATRNNINSLQLLRAFLKSWVAKQPKELEAYFQLYSRNETVETKVIRFLRDEGRVTLIVPGVHPGPFYPVGSYNLSETLYRKIRTDDSIPMILHGAGGHERNLPTSENTQLYAAKVQEFVSSLEADQTGGFAGPIRREFGGTTTTNLVFGADVLTIVSKAPYDSDDLDPRIIDEALYSAKERGLNLTLIDAHNSIGGETAPQGKVLKDDWLTLFNSLKNLEPKDFLIGYAHSSEISFVHGPDISEAGIGVLMLQSGKSKGVLVVVDSNNAKVGLREKLAGALEERGLELIELCTSDTHNLAARSLVSRGYYALGEATEETIITETVSKLVTISERRLGKSKYIASNFSMVLPMIGTEYLTDLASLTNKAIEYTKRYVKKISPLLILVLGITLFY